MLTQTALASEQIRAALGVGSGAVRDVTPLGR